MREKVLIGGASGFWGEASHATAQLLRFDLRADVKEFRTGVIATCVTVDADHDLLMGIQLLLIVE